MVHVVSFGITFLEEKSWITLEIVSDHCIGCVVQVFCAELD